MADCGTGATNPQRTACIPGLRFLSDPTDKPYNTSGGTVYERTGRICLESEPFSLRRTKLNDFEPPKWTALFMFPDQMRILHPRQSGCIPYRCSFCLCILTAEKPDIARLFRYGRRAGRTDYPIPAREGFLICRGKPIRKRRTRPASPAPDVFS